MNNLLTKLYIGTVTKIEAAKAKSKENLMSDERGVAPIVATILIVLIVVLLVAVFYDKLSVWFKTTMDSIFDEAGTVKKDKLT